MLNQVTLIGRIATDVELRYTPNQNAVANFVIAVNRPKSKNDETDFIPVVAWRKQAENTANYLSKGSKLAVTGQIQISKWQNNEGQNRQKAEVVAESVVFLDNKKGQDVDPSELPEEVKEDWGL